MALNPLTEFFENIKINKKTLQTKSERFLIQINYTFRLGPHGSKRLLALEKATKKEKLPVKYRKTVTSRCL